MIKTIYQDENYKLDVDQIYNPLTQKTVNYYRVIPQKNTLYMMIEVVDDRFFARFPEGLSFTGDNSEMWVQAIKDAESFIQEAKAALLTQAA